MTEETKTETAREHMNGNAPAPDGQRTLGPDELVVIPVRTFNIITGTLGELPWKDVQQAFQAIQTTAMPLEGYLKNERDKLAAEQKEKENG